ncbi:MAG TPA: RNase adapter RapZ [Blastocatellia bacterium]|nr:RNase adapter RapZ [Blastocatellia bacterium]
MAVPVVIVTGISGSGMSSALKAFEDLGYLAVDNLPVQLIPTFVRLAEESSEIDRTAFVVDVRSRDFVGTFPRIHEELVAKGVDVTILFLEADDEVLLRRFSETRRPHPLPEQDVVQAIRHERDMLKVIRGLADIVIDTSDHTVHTLRQVIKDRFAEKSSANELNLTISSFGYRHGLPRGLDMLFDVRFLPNPHFIPELRPLTGRDREVIDFLDSKSEVEETIDRFVDLLTYLLPRFQREGKSYLSVGIGCTGGRHRSVVAADRLQKRLAELGYKARVLHRDIEKEPQRYKIGDR